MQRIYYIYYMGPDFLGYVWGSRNEEILPLPPQVTGLALSVVGPGEIGLTWDVINGVVLYRVERSLDGSSGWSEIGTAAATSYADFANLYASTQYFYRVRGANAAGNGPYSSTVSGTTSPSPLLSGLKESFDFGNSGNLGLGSLGNANLTNQGGVTQVVDAGPGGHAAQFVAASAQRLRMARPAAALSFGASVKATIVFPLILTDKAANYYLVSKLESGLREYYLQLDSTADRLVFAVSPDGSSEVSVTANRFGALGPAGTRIWCFGRYDGAYIEIAATTGQFLGKFDLTAHSADIFAAGAVFNLGSTLDGSNYLNGVLPPVRLWGRALENRDLIWLCNGALGRSFAEISAYAPARKGPTTAAHIQYVPGVTQGAEGRGTPYLVCADHPSQKPLGAWWRMLSFKHDAADVARAAQHRSLWIKGATGGAEAGSQFHHAKHTDGSFDQLSTEMSTTGVGALSGEALGNELPIRFGQWHTMIGSFNPATQGARTRANAELMYGSGYAEFILPTALGSPTLWTATPMAIGANHVLGSEFASALFNNDLLFDGGVEADIASGAVAWLYNLGYGRDLRRDWSAFAGLFPDCASRRRLIYPLDEASGARSELFGAGPDYVPWLWNVGAGGAVGSGPGIGA